MGAGLQPTSLDFTMSRMKSPYASRLSASESKGHDGQVVRGVRSQS